MKSKEICNTGQILINKLKTSIGIADDTCYREPQQKKLPDRVLFQITDECLLIKAEEYACKIYTAHVSPQILFGLIFRQKATFVASL